MNNINYNTYLSLSPLILRAGCSIGRATSGKYKITTEDIKNGWTFELEQSSIKLLVPFKALFSTNNKLDGIPGFNFSSSIGCNSRRLGLCQLKNNSICYALRGQLQSGGVSRGTHGKKGFLKMNSYWSDILTSVFIKKAAKDKKLFDNFVKYLDSKVPLLRFNKGGDFKDRQDVLFLEALAINCSNTIFYGYTARDDLKINFMSSNIYLNGSNKKYTNQFKATNDLKTYINAPLQCLGACKNCGKCWTCKDKTIYCFIHGKKDDIKLLVRTAANIKYLNDILAALKINYDLNQSDDIFKDFLKCLDDFNGSNLFNKYDIKELKFALYNLDIFNEDINKNELLRGL